jgi:hypothetical protein
MAFSLSLSPRTLRRTILMPDVNVTSYQLQIQMSFDSYVEELHTMPA